eukprot:Phypoly_transcript_14184.p1 GENE.Phypoly_transcript_14184~~Phypoly_transcript_14184.p1  ORF type:complete len:180 (+),score=31.16 Phypoly_transcript_14184:437-976(+)
MGKAAYSSRRKSVSPYFLRKRQHERWLIGPPLHSNPFGHPTAIKNKRAQRIGKGLNIWNWVNDLYIILLKKLLAGELQDRESQGYYFPENGEFSWDKIHDEIQKILHKKGISKETTPAEVNSDDEIKQAYGFVEAQYYISGNSRIKGNKARKVGWTPKHSVSEINQGIADDVEFVLSQQ